MAELVVPAEVVEVVAVLAVVVAELPSVAAPLEVEEVPVVGVEVEVAAEVSVWPVVEVDPDPPPWEHGPAPRVKNMDNTSNRIVEE